MRATLSASLFGLLFVTTAGCGSTSYVRSGDPRKDLRSPDPLIVRAACNNVAKQNDLESVPLLFENLLRDDAAVRSASYECFLRLVQPRLASAVELDRINNLFGYSFAFAPAESVPAVERMKGWYAHYTGDTEADLRTNDVVTIQLACLRAVDQDDLDAIPHLIQLLRHEEVPVRSFAHAAFAALVSPTGENGERHPEAVTEAFRFQSAGAEDERETAVVAIENWYLSRGREAVQRAKARREGKAAGARPAPASDN